nr:hypothetical protein [Streptomyces sp. NEAU-383]
MALQDSTRSLGATPIPYSGPVAPYSRSRVAAGESGAHSRDGEQYRRLIAEGRHRRFFGPARETAVVDGRWDALALQPGGARVERLPEGGEHQHLLPMLVVPAQPLQK